MERNKRVACGLTQHYSVSVVRMAFDITEKVKYLPKKKASACLLYGIPKIILLQPYFLLYVLFNFRHIVSILFLNY